MKQTFKHIVVPTDFGAAAQAALDLGISLAETYGAQLTLTHVFGVPMGYAYDGIVSWPIDDLRRVATEELDKATVEAKSRFPGIKSYLGMGDVTQQILDLVAASRVDLIVMGTHGRRGISRVLLGSVAEKTVRLSSVPVLTVPSWPPQ